MSKDALAIAIEKNPPRPGRAVRVLVFEDDPDRKPQLYVCPTCGGVNSPLIYLATKERQHECAQQAASECYSCMTDRACQGCGEMVGSKHYTHCAPCRLKNKLAKAKVLSADHPEATIWDMYCGYDGDSYYPDLQEAADDGHEYVHPCKFTPFALNIEGKIDSLLEDHFEDASPDDLKDLAELYAAVEKFNKAQTGGSFYPNTDVFIDVRALKDSSQ